MAILVPELSLPDCCIECYFELAMTCRLLHKMCCWDTPDVCNPATWTLNGVNPYEERRPDCPLQDFSDVMQSFFEVVEKKTYEALSTSKNPACTGTFNKAELESLIEKIGANPYPEERCP